MADKQSLIGGAFKVVTEAAAKAIAEAKLMKTVKNENKDRLRILTKRLEEEQEAVVTYIKDVSDGNTKYSQPARAELRVAIMDTLEEIKILGIVHLEDTGEVLKGVAELLED